MTTAHTATPDWQVDGEDGKAILLLNMADDPDDANSTVIRVYNRGKEAVAAKAALALNAYDKDQGTIVGLVKALQKAAEVLDDVRGNINPERGFADVLEADVNDALNTIQAELAKAASGAA